MYVCWWMCVCIHVCVLVDVCVFMDVYGCVLVDKVYVQREGVNHI